MFTFTCTCELCDSIRAGTAVICVKACSHITTSISVQLSPSSYSIVDPFLSSQCKNLNDGIYNYNQQYIIHTLTSFWATSTSALVHSTESEVQLLIDGNWCEAVIVYLLWNVATHTSYRFHLDIISFVSHFLRLANSDWNYYNYVNVKIGITVQFFFFGISFNYMNIYIIYNVYILILADSPQIVSLCNHCWLSQLHTEILIIINDYTKQISKISIIPCKQRPHNHFHLFGVIFPELTGNYLQLMYVPLSFQWTIYEYLSSFHFSNTLSQEVC